MKGRGKPLRLDGIAGPLFLLPSLAGVALFYLIPFAMSVGYALRSAQGAFVGLANFRALLSNEAFRRAVANTLRFLAVGMPLILGLPLLMGCLLNGVRRNEALTALFLSPLVIPSACIAFLFQSLFAANGLVSQLSGASADWMRTGYAFPILILIYVWKNMGCNLILVMAGLAGIPREVYEWSAMEGMGRARMFFQVTLVYLAPTLFLMLVMSFVNSFKVFREIYMMSGAYPHESIYMLQHYMNNQFSAMNYPNLTAASILVTIVVAAFVVASSRGERRFEPGG